MDLQKVISKKNVEKIFFFYILKVTDLLVKVPHTKFHGSATLVERYLCMVGGQ